MENLEDVHSDHRSWGFYVWDIIRKKKEKKIMIYTR